MGRDGEVMDSEGGMGWKERKRKGGKEEGKGRGQRERERESMVVNEF